MKTYITLFALMLCSGAMAQETYESAAIATEDLNGTARYVAMGGAMEALGADISTMSTNPAGIGMFRKGWIGTSFGVVTQAEQDDLPKTDKTAMSFDQFGAVWANKVSSTSYINCGFNYRKSRNFNQILPAIGSLNGSSITKMSYINAFHDYQATQVDDLLDNTILKDEYGTRYYNDGDNFEFRRDNKGYIGEYDFNISGNHNDRIYWGVTFGYKHVYYSGKTEYLERLVDSYGDCGGIMLTDHKDIDGGGFDIKAGIIFRPVEYSPFRIGISVQTPTWYELDASNYTTLDNFTDDGTGYVYGVSNFADISESHKYRMNTPWKFGLSLAHTIENKLALGLSYEFADYGSVDNRIIGEYEYSYGWYNDYYHADSDPDDLMNENTEYSLKGVHTLKLGAEYKVSPELALRAGYNFVSPMYSKDGYRDFELYQSDGVYYSSTTDYTNWKDTHRLTFGVGYNLDNFNIDLAYQLSTTKGDFYPFPGNAETLKWEDGYQETVDNLMGATKVKNERHQLLLTLGYRF